MDDQHRQIGENIRALAKERGLALSHLADRCTASRSHFWAVLNAERSPTVRWLGLVAAELGVQVEDLVRLQPPSAKQAADSGRRSRSKRRRR